MVALGLSDSVILSVWFFFLFFFVWMEPGEPERFIDEDPPRPSSGGLE